MNFNGAMLETAGAYLGLEEYPGARHNDTVVGFFDAVGHSWVKDDETPWCAAFVGAVLAQVGLPHTGKLNARSYLDWGREVHQSEAKPGDVVVFWRGKPTAATGHVAFLVRFDGDGVIVRGGNQGNKVSDQRYPITRVLSYRRATGAAPDGVQPLQFGAKGYMVRDMQTRLAELGYHVGQIDGDFGAITRAAVLAFQADNGLATDAVVGALTREALQIAQPRPTRDVTAADLRADGSKTLRNTDVIDVAAPGVGVVAAIPAIKDAVNEAEGLLPTLTSLISEHWPTLLVVGGLVVLWWAGRQIKAARIEDAQSGAHIGR